MKIKLISLFYFSLSISVFGQNKAVDTIKKTWTYKPNFLVGFDLMSAGTSAFSDRKLLQGFASSQLTNKVHAVLDIGFDKNTYKKNSYNAEVKGLLAKLGGFYMLSQDRENPFNGFYAGGKLAAAFYQQEYFAIPVRAIGGGADGHQSLPQSSQSSYWTEAVLGGRVQLFDSSFFIDVNVQPRYLVYTTKQNDIVPMLIPGFGGSSSKFGFGFSWNIAYQF